MSLPTPLTVGERSYQAVFDLSTFFDALIYGQVRDDSDGRALGRSVLVTAARTGTTLEVTGSWTKVTEGGQYCLAGEPTTAFPPSSPAVAYSVDLTFSEPRHRTRVLTVPVPVGASFPIAAPEVRLRPIPISLQGRVTRASDGAPVAGATVRLVDDPHPPAPLTAHVLALRSPLANAHPDGAAVQVLNAIPPARVLAVDLDPAASVCTLDDRSGLNPGDVLHFGPLGAGDGPAAELIVPPPAVAAAAGEVQLSAALGVALPAGTPVQGFTPQVGAHLVGASDPGDALVLVDASLAGAPVLLAGAAPSQAEIRLVGAETDGQGFYELDGVGRVAAVFVTATSGALSAGPAATVLDLSRRVNIVDLLAS